MTNIVLQVDDLSASRLRFNATSRPGSLSIRLFGGGGGKGEERKGKREEKPDTKALRRVFRPLDEHDASP